MSAPEMFPDESVFVIEPKLKRWRYLLSGGRTLDVLSPYGSSSYDRERVLVEARRRWGGKKDDWKIEGATEIFDTYGIDQS